MSTLYADKASHESNQWPFTTYILGLRNNYRGAELEKQLKLFGIFFEIQWGLEPERDLVEINCYQNKEFQKFVYRRNLSKKEIACTLGHRKIYESFLRSRFEWALVLEDDSELIHDPSILIEALPKVTLPILINIHDSASIRMVKKRNLDKISKELCKKEGDFQMRSLIDAISGTYGYVLNRKSAEELLALKFRNSLGVADWPYGTSKRVKIYDVLPPIVSPRKAHDQSIIGARDSIKVRRAFRIPRPDRAFLGMCLGIPRQIAFHQEVVLKITTLFAEFNTRVMSRSLIRQFRIKRKW